MNFGNDEQNFTSSDKAIIKFSEHVKSSAVQVTTALSRAMDLCLEIEMNDYRSVVFDQMDEIEYSIDKMRTALVLLDDALLDCGLDISVFTENQAEPSVEACDE